jgi:hypothetical protein
MRDGRAGGGGAIDLVQYLKDVSFREAVRELGGLKFAAVPPAKASPVISPAADTRPLPTPAADRAARAHWYLTEVRGIPASLVDQELESGRVFADTRGNVVFRLRDETGREVGYEVRGTYDKPYHSVHGEKGIFVTKADRTPTAAFVESGIEALSYRALRGTGLVFSTTGSAVELPAKMGSLLKDRGYEIVAAFNADKAGDRMAERLRELLGFSVRRDRPTGVGKDWNEQLQSQRAHRTRSGAGPEPGAETEKFQAVTSVTATGRVR